MFGAQAAIIQLIALRVTNTMLENICTWAKGAVRPRKFIIAGAGEAYFCQTPCKHAGRHVPLQGGYVPYQEET